MALVWRGAAGHDSHRVGRGLPTIRSLRARSPSQHRDPYAFINRNPPPSAVTFFLVVARVQSRKPSANATRWRFFALASLIVRQSNCHADAPFLAPSDVAGLVQAVGLNDQLKPVRYIDRTLHLKCRTGGRQVFHSAASGSAGAELDRSSF
jgi:hypothetical protein